MFGEKLVDDFGEELMGDEGGVFVVGDYDAGDAFGAAVGVEGVCCFFVSISLGCSLMFMSVSLG